MIHLQSVIDIVEATEVGHRANCRRYGEDAPLAEHGSKCAVNVRDQILRSLKANVPQQPIICLTSCGCDGRRPIDECSGFGGRCSRCR